MYAKQDSWHFDRAAKSRSIVFKSCGKNDEKYLAIFTSARMNKKLVPSSS